MAGLVQFVPASVTMEAERKQALEAQAAPIITGLAGHIKECFDAAKRAKETSELDKRLLACMKQRQGIYSDEKLAAIKQQGGSEVWMHITETKCRAAESWLREILLSDEEAPWDLSATPIPDLPEAEVARIRTEMTQQALLLLQTTGQVPTPETMIEIREELLSDTRKAIMDEAAEAVGLMKLKIQDQMAEGGWSKALNGFLTDFATFPFAVVKAPIVEARKQLTWDRAAGFTPVVADKLIPVFRRVSPFDAYWEPGIGDIQDGYFIEKHRMTKGDLANMRSMEGFSKEAIELVLTDYEQGKLNNWIDSVSDTQKDLEGKTTSVESPTPQFDALQYWGDVTGDLLVDWGVDEAQVPDPFAVYSVEAWMVGAYVIKATINGDPLGRKPYRISSWIRQPGSLVGKALPEVISDIQDVCNASARALVNNMGIASGPLVEVNVERLADGEEVTQLYPWKIMQTKNSTFGTSEPAVRFNQPTSIVEGLMGVYEKFSRLADDHSGIPAYVYGDLDVQGAGRTSSGLSMLMGSAGKSIKQVIMYLDQDIVKGVIQSLYEFNMLYDDDESIKGDANVVPRGALNLMIKEQLNNQRMQFLQMTANPADMQIIGMDGRAAVLREISKGLQMPSKDIVPSDADMKAKQMQMQQMQQMAPPPEQTA